MEGTRRTDSTSVGIHTCETSIQKRCEGCVDTAWGRYWRWPHLLVAKICTRLKKIIRFQKRRPLWNLEKLYAQRQRVQDTLEEKFGAIGCDSGNVEVQWNNIYKYKLLDTISDLVGKVEKRARKPWITQGMISKMEERTEWKNVNTEEGRKNYRMMRNKLKRATYNAKRISWEHM